MRSIWHQPVSTLLHPDHQHSQTAIILRELMRRAILGKGPARYEDLASAVWREGIFPDCLIHKRISDARKALKAAGVPLKTIIKGTRKTGRYAVYWLTSEDVARLTPAIHPAVVWRWTLFAALILLIAGIEIGVVIGQLLERGGSCQ